MLTIQCANDEAPIELASSFTPEEQRTLRRFAEAQAKLAALTALQKRPRYMEFADDPQVGGVVRWKPEPSDEEIAALLHRLRPFILHREPFSFNTVTSVMKRRLVHPAIRAVFDEERKRYEGIVWQKELRISSGATVINSDEVFTNWLNALEYHRDDERLPTMEALLESSVPGLIYWVMLKMLFEKVQAIANVAEVARVVTGLQPTVQFNGCTLQNGGA